MKRPQTNSVEVLLDTGKVVQITRTALSNMDRLLQLQEQLIKMYINCDGAIGSIIASDEAVSALTELCSLLPVKDDKAPLDYETIKDNWEQTILLFFNGGLDLDTREVSGDNILVPSKVSSLHFFPYVPIIRKYALLKQKEELPNLGTQE